MWSQGLRK
ncbi:hypothetical protein Nmel_013073 [Mimus melanotis]|uniref:Uncharacterized protein n=1 Tax=Bambusicola thoracicus TaxID=9083 RepID=A0A2P4TBF5_BAMTH|nr:hypothetical protein CIB84_002557 [Bambusicola thoracicus]